MADLLASLVVRAVYVYALVAWSEWISRPAVLAWVSAS